MEHSRSRKSAFTLVELLVVIGIIAVLLGILLPSLNKARQTAKTTACLSNLRVMGQALQMYLVDTKGYIPYPTTTAGEETLWNTAMDKYIYSLADKQRTGVAKGRGYSKVKQCVVYDEFDDKAPAAGQGTLKEFAKTYKMNTMLRRKLRTASQGPWVGTSQIASTCANVNQLKGDLTTWVFLGDGMSLDQFGPIPSQPESGRFSMGVDQDDSGDAWVAPRHNGGANIVFLDGHAANIKLRPSKVDHTPSHGAAAGSSPLPASWMKICWPSQWVDASGAEQFPMASTEHILMCEQGAAGRGHFRNPEMPLRWSDPDHWIIR